MTLCPRSFCPRNIDSQLFQYSIIVFHKLLIHVFTFLEYRLTSSKNDNSLACSLSASAILCIVSFVGFRFPRSMLEIVVAPKYCYMHWLLFYK